MEPAVRGARVESAIKQGPGLERSVVPSKNSQDSRAAWGIGPSQPRARGTEFLDAETDGQKPLFRRLETDMKTRVNSKSRVPRDKCTGIRRSSIPADWVVETIWTVLAAPHPVFELVSALESGTEFFEAETTGRNSAEVSRVSWRLHNYRVLMVE
jgi:hypothetical protein